MQVIQDIGKPQGGVMEEIDCFGRISITAENSTPRHAWAYAEFNQIDPELIFASKDAALRRAILMLGNEADVIPVLITGLDIKHISR